MYTLGQLDEHNWACTLPTVLTRDVAKLAISFLSVLIPRKFDCLRSYLTLGRERNISPLTGVQSPLICMCIILRLCLYCYVQKVSNTISVTQIVIINMLLIVLSIYQNSGLGWRCALIGYSSAKILCYPPPSNSYGFALKNIAIVEGINELKSSFEHYYLTVVVYTQFKHISFQNIYSPQCQWPYQWIFIMRLFS